MGSREELIEIFEPLNRLTKDIKTAAITLGDREARFLVYNYYMLQDARIRQAHQMRGLGENREPNAVLDWMMNNSRVLERNMKTALAAYSQASPVGRWAESIYGIGPIISAGLLAHIDITKAPTVGHIWSYAGLNPTQVWAPKETRPWNADLKKLCWKIGESFVKVSSYEGDIYGKVYLARKAQEETKNAVGDFADLAKAELEKKNYDKTTETYKAYISGRLPAGRIHARAKRYAVKLFLSHWHHVAYQVRFSAPPPKPYVIEHKGHADFIAPPNWP